MNALTDPAPANVFAVTGRDPVPAISVRVNFGVFAGREVTSVELGELAGWLLDEVSSVSIISEVRHEFGDNVEAAVHLVRVEVAADEVPAAEESRVALEEKLVERTRYWYRLCLANRHSAVIDS